MNDLRPIDFNGHTPDVDLEDFQPDTIEYWKRRSRHHEEQVRKLQDSPGWRRKDLITIVRRLEVKIDTLLSRLEEGPEC